MAYAHVGEPDVIARIDCEKVVDYITGKLWYVFDHAHRESGILGLSGASTAVLLRI